VKFCQLLKNKNIYETTDQTHTHKTFYNKKRYIQLKKKKLMIIVFFVSS